MLLSQLTERLSLTDLRVVRMAAKSREGVSTAVDHLTLHHQVRNLDTPEKGRCASRSSRMLRVSKHR